MNYPLPLPSLTLLPSSLFFPSRLTAEEIIGWMRIVRPGSVIGPQQQFLKDIQGRMWREGEAIRPVPRLSSGGLLPAVAAAKDESTQIHLSHQSHRPGSSSSNHNSPNNLASLPSNSPSAPSSSSSSSANTLAKRFGKLGLNASPPVSGPSPAASSSSNYLTGKPSTPLDTKGSPLLPSSSSAKTMSSRPSSRGPSRGDSKPMGEEEKEGSQGDQLRLRRQQHLQNSAVYSLTTNANPSSSSPASLSPSSPSSYTPPKGRLSFGFSGDLAGSSKMQPDSPSHGGGPGSGSNTPNSSRPRSRLGGFLSAWNK